MDQNILSSCWEKIVERKPNTSGILAGFYKIYNNNLQQKNNYNVINLSDVLATP